MLSLAVHASKEAQSGRYFNKTTEELDQLSLVRDRNGRRNADGAEREDEEQELQADDSIMRDGSPPEANVSTRQREMEADWGLEPQAADESSAAQNAAVDEDDESPEAQSHQSEPEEDLDQPLFPIGSPKVSDTIPRGDLLSSANRMITMPCVMTRTRSLRIWCFTLIIPSTLGRTV